MENYKPIEDYGLIGDLHTVALVGMDGSIDFMSFPDFDSPTIFAALLDHRKGGRFQIAPLIENPNRKQLYLPDTAILLTRFLSRGGVAEISDFMPVNEPEGSQKIIRRAKTVRGEIRFRMICQPRFDYAREGHRLDVKPNEVLFSSNGNDRTVLRLQTSVPIRVENGAAFAEFTLRAGETAAFVLEQVSTRLMSASTSVDYVASSFKNTANFWRNWIGHSNYRGRWREIVNRSALTLKLLTSEKYGSIVAAPTLGLPEVVGGIRNWDYRYAWIRDGSFTLYALMRLGYTTEAVAYMKWIEARCSELEPDGSLQPLYTIVGQHEIAEQTLSEFEGYMQSSPVRIGNGAYRQLQLDIYGELMDSVYLYDKYGEPVSYDFWCNLARLIDWVCANWNQPDQGVWEVRGGRREFLQSRIMCWAAIDRGIRLAQKRSFPAPVAAWRAARDTIYQDIFANFWHPQRQCFTQYKGSNKVDAATLLMPLIKFIGPKDPRWLSTLQAIESDLVSDSLVFRYRLDDEPLDGLSGTEGTFSMCSFWYVECLARSGDPEKARYLFEKALGYANHLGLFAEQLGPRGQHLGNYPQALTHIALISAAYEIDRRLPTGRS